MGVFAVAQPLSRYQEQRAAPRFEVEVSATIEVGEAQHEARITNLSLGGAGLVVMAVLPLPIGTRMGVSFAVPGLDAPISVQAEIRWVSNVDQRTMGVQFVTGLRARETFALQGWLRRLQSSSG